MSEPATLSAAEAKAQKSRAFLINIMMTFLISVTVFAVGTYYFVIPRLLEQDRSLRDVREWARRQKVAQGEAAAAAVEAAPAAAPAGDATAAAPAAPAAPAAQ